MAGKSFFYRKNFTSDVISGTIRKNIEILTERVKRMQISENTRKMAREAEIALRDIFEDIDEIARVGTEKVLDVFREERVSEGMFAASTGYGYGDMGRDAIDRIAAKVFGAEAGFMRPSILSGTHALTIGLFALLRPGDVMLSITGAPYDTLREVIGMDGANGDGSLADFGVHYDDVDFAADGSFDFDGIDITPRGLESIDALPRLAEAFSRIGYSDTLIRKIFFENANRFFKGLFKDPYYFFEK
jgi:cystathionine beta-lyase family protein involved in aluminum resistance